MHEKIKNENRKMNEKQSKKIKETKEMIEIE